MTLSGENKENKHQRTDNKKEGIEIYATTETVLKRLCPQTTNLANCRQKFVSGRPPMDTRLC